VGDQPTISVSMGELDRASKRLDEPAKSLREGHLNFVTAVAPLGPHPWGVNDDMAQLFIEEYVGQSELVLRLIGELANGIEGLRGKVRLMQQRLVDVEEANSS
jgi:hypothetical protein